MSSHILPRRVYFAVFFALVLLTFVTTWAAGVDFGMLNTVVALGIGSVKMMLVVLYFMHLRYSSKLIWIFAGASIFWFVILVVLTMADYGTRYGVPAW